MGSWGIAKTASPKEKLKSKYADFINGLNCVGDISYNTYCELFDFGMDLFDKIYDLGKSEINVEQQTSTETTVIRETFTLTFNEAIEKIFNEGGYLQGDEFASGVYIVDDNGFLIIKDANEENKKILDFRVARDYVRQKYRHLTVATPESLLIEGPRITR